MRWFRTESETTEHEYSQERLSAYLDEELSPGERSRVEHHMEGCSRCRCDLDNLRRTVQWTMALPAVPCPRSFVIPVPAPAKRPQKVQRVWGMPALQGATALVAVLFLLAVVGEAFLPRARPALAPAPAAVEREAAAVAEVTEVVELEVEPIQLMVAEAPAEATAAPEARVVVETVVVESVQDQAAAAASAAPPGMGMGGEGAEVQPPPAAATDTAPKALVGAAGSSALPTATPWPSQTIEPSATPEPTAEPDPTETPSPAPTLVPTVALAPTLVAAADAQANTSPRGEGGAAETVVQPLHLGWLAVAAIALGVAFVMLGTLTIILMIRRIRQT